MNLFAGHVSLDLWDWKLGHDTIQGWFFGGLHSIVSWFLGSAGKENLVLSSNQIVYVPFPKILSLNIMHGHESNVNRAEYSLISVHILWAPLCQILDPPFATLDAPVLDSLDWSCPWLYQWKEIQEEGVDVDQENYFTHWILLKIEILTS